MLQLPSDQPHLHRSLELAEDAAAFASPNPTVGCVLVRDGRKLAEGAHRYDGRDHAEIVALKAAAAAGEDLRGATAYVTLEPCSHHGRTGPCADALIAAGIRRCVVATVDPNPLVSGSGLARLRAAGVEVDLLDPDAAPESVLVLRARGLNDAFAFAVRHGRPFVTLKAALSRDGKLAPPPAKRIAAGPFWLTGAAARDDVQRLRHLSDAVLTGIGTVLADDPSLTDRTGLERRAPLLRVVLDAQLRTPLNSRLAESAERDLLLLTAEDAPQRAESELRAAGARIIRLPDAAGKLDLPQVLATLGSLAVRGVLVEAGSTLNGSLLEANLVDKLVLYTAPTELGPAALPFAHNVTLSGTQARLSKVSETCFPNGEGEDLRTTGYLHDPWSDLK